MTVFRLRWSLLLAGFVVAALPPPAAGMDRLRYEDFPHLNGKSVRQVLILGNNITQEEVFRREMSLTEGLPFDSASLWRDWENLLDLGIFAQIEVDAVPSADGVLVVVSVQERPRWFLAPLFDYNLDDKVFTVGYRLRVRNVHGMNQNFRSTSRFGGRNRIDLSWSTPWLGTEPRTLSTSLRVELPGSLNDDLRSSRLSVGTTKFVGDFRRLRRGWSAFGGMEVLERDSTSPFGEVDQLIPSVGLGWFRDSRNVRVDPTRGSLLSFSSVYSTGFTRDELSYIRGFTDLRKFVSVGSRIVLAGRVVSVLSNGEVPDYRRVGVGGANSIRGQPSDVQTGKNLARGGVEMRFALLRKRRFNLPIPFAPKRVKNFDIRFDGVLFADAGSAWDDGIGFRDANLERGYGFGLRIFLPVVEVARFEVAFDEQGEVTFYFQEGNLI